MGLREILIQAQRFLRRLLCFRKEILIIRLAECMKQYVTFRDSGIRKRVVRVLLNRLLVERDALTQIIAAASVPEETSFVVEMIGLEVFGRAPIQPVAFVGVEFKRQGKGYTFGDRVLQGKDIGLRLVEVLRPQK